MPDPKPGIDEKKVPWCTYACEFCQGPPDGLSSDMWCLITGEGQYTEPDGGPCLPSVRNMAEEIERLKRELAEAKADLMLSPSAICAKYHIQNCSGCEQLECCDNTNKIKKQLATARAEGMEEAATWHEAEAARLLEESERARHPQHAIPLYKKAEEHREYATAIRRLGAQDHLPEPTEMVEPCETCAGSRMIQKHGRGGFGAPTPCPTCTGQPGKKEA